MNHLSLSKCDVYLSETDVKDVLKEEEMNHVRQKLVPIDLSGTMKDMEKRHYPSCYGGGGDEPDPRGETTGNSTCHAMEKTKIVSI